MSSKAGPCPFLADGDGACILRAGHQGAHETPSSNRRWSDWGDETRERLPLIPRDPITAETLRAALEALSAPDRVELLRGASEGLCLMVLGCGCTLGDDEEPCECGEGD